MPADWYSLTNKASVQVRVLLSPRSKNNKILGVHNERLKISLNAPPVDGKANKALLQFLAGQLGVPRSMICLIRGQTSREKTVEISMDCCNDLLLRLDGLLKDA